MNKHALHSLWLPVHEVQVLFSGIDTNAVAESMTANSPRSHYFLSIPASTRLMQNAPRNFIVATKLCSALPQSISGPRPLADVLDASLDCIVGTWIDVAAQLSPHSSLRLSLALALADLGGVLLVHEILDDVVQVGIPPGQ